MKRSFYLLLILSALTLLTGMQSCSLFLQKRKSTITASTPGSEILYLNGGKKYKRLDTSASTIEVSNYYWLLIKNSKPGYQTSTYMIRDSAFNPKKFIDLGLALAFVVSGVMLMPAFYDRDPIENPAFLLLGSGFVNIVFGRFKHYPREIKLPPLQPVPARNNSERFLIIDELKVDLKPDSICEKTYQNLRFYSLNAVKQKTYGKKSIFYNDQFLLEDMNNMLTKTGFADNSNSQIKNTFNSVRINVAITSVTFHEVYLTQKTVTMGVRFSLHEMNSKNELYSKHFVAKSQIFLPDQVNTDEEIITSTLENALYSFLSDSAIYPFLESKEEAVSQKIDSLSEILLDDSGHPTKYNDAMNSVVTIIRGETHGSGCIVSRDGYILTTLNVTQDREEDLTVVFNNSEKKKCRIDRVNEKYDLALLKVDTSGLIPLKIRTEKTIEAGDEVFAIGTPADLHLGQTLSKGIISGKRKMNDLVYIQTDVTINIGQSGGALLNEKGELIGIINARLFNTGYEGIGFGIPTYYLYDALKIKTRN